MSGPDFVTPAVLLAGGLLGLAVTALAVRAFRRANRVIREVPVRSNVVPLTTRNGVKVIPAQKNGRAS